MVCVYDEEVECVGESETARDAAGREAAIELNEEEKDACHGTSVMHWNEARRVAGAKIGSRGNSNHPKIGVKSARLSRDYPTLHRICYMLPRKAFLV